MLPEKNKDYETKEYWDQRYTDAADASFDWFKSYSQIADLISDCVRREDRILMLGCGNSTLSEEMYDAGYRNIVNIDFSSVVIETMRKKRPEMTSRKGLEMDIRVLDFPAHSFDVAIDKGTMDAMMAAEGDVWDPDPRVVDNCNKEVDEVIRVLRPDKSAFLYLTFGQPHFRRRYLQRENTTLEIRKLGDAFHYYFYILRKSSK